MLLEEVQKKDTSPNKIFCEETGWQILSALNQSHINYNPLALRGLFILSILKKIIKMKNTFSKKGILFLLLLFLLFLVWIELGVGIFGTPWAGS